MNISDLLQDALAAGVRVYLRGGKVRLRGSDAAMEVIRAKLAPHKTEILAYLRSAEQRTGEFWPWAPYLTIDDVRRLRADLIGIIEELASLECWPKSHTDDVLSRAIRGPLADLMPNIHHFADRLAAARAEAQARHVASRMR